MTDTVLGMDLSLTATGLAAVLSDHSFHTRSVKTVGRRGDSLADRERRIHSIVHDVVSFAEFHGADLAVIEGPSIMSKGGSNWDRAWLWGEAVSALGAANIAVAAPTVVKKWATGRGNADKASVAVGVARLWDQFECESDNEADALALASMGSQRMRMGVVPVRSHHEAALLKVEWPPFITDRDEMAAERSADLTEDARDRYEEDR
jgi:crossover junction endodeoxyribonuclease RuvC